MNDQSVAADVKPTVTYYGGIFGTLLPFIIFIVGVISIALSGAPDEKGFWPVLILALSVGLILAKDKTGYSNAVIDGMSERMVMIMITAWILASMIGILMTITGFVESLTWLTSLFDLSRTGYLVSAFIICCVVSLSTGTSFGTILICAPILYPTGGLMGVHLASLAGAILAGATFGDFIAPISDTTISSALSQEAEIGPTVRSRLKYVFPAFIIALIAFIISGSIHNDFSSSSNALQGDPKGLPMIFVPVLIIWLFLKGKHLLHGLLFGLLFGVIVGLAFGILSFDQILSLDLDNYTAQSFVIDGINRVVGLSFFTILLMGLVGTLRASGLMDKLLQIAASRSKTVGQGEAWISLSAWSAVMLTTHSIVAILMVADFVKSSGRKLGIGAIRRANILSLVVCVFPFLLPYFIPVILMSTLTSSGQDLGIASVSPLEVGLNNFVAWGLLLIVIVSVVFGYGRRGDAGRET